MFSQVQLRQWTGKVAVTAATTINRVVHGRSRPLRNRGSSRGIASSVNCTEWFDKHAWAQDSSNIKLGAKVCWTRPLVFPDDDACPRFFRRSPIPPRTFGSTFLFVEFGAPRCNNFCCRSFYDGTGFKRLRCCATTYLNYKTRWYREGMLPFFQSLCCYTASFSL